MKTKVAKILENEDTQFVVMKDIIEGSGQPCINIIWVEGDNMFRVVKPCMNLNDREEEFASVSLNECLVVQEISLQKKVDDPSWGSEDGYRGPKSAEIPHDFKRE